MLQKGNNFDCMEIGLLSVYQMYFCIPNATLRCGKMKLNENQI